MRQGHPLAGKGQLNLASFTQAEHVRIIAAGTGHGPVSLSRFDVDVVVTEHGAADLRNLGHEARAQALIGIAAPHTRETLARHWRDAMRGLQEA
jgi:acyl-CoA hydrolase